MIQFTAFVEFALCPYHDVLAATEGVGVDGAGLEQHLRVVAGGLAGGRAVEVPDGAASWKADETDRGQACASHQNVRGVRVRSAPKVGSTMASQMGHKNTQHFHDREYSQLIGGGHGGGQGAGLAAEVRARATNPCDMKNTRTTCPEVRLGQRSPTDFGHVPEGLRVALMILVEVLLHEYIGLYNTLACLRVLKGPGTRHLLVNPGFSVWGTYRCTRPGKPRPGAGT